MQGTRIPLELIQKVFFGDDDGISEEARAFHEGEANDFKVHKNPDPPLPQHIKPPPYPKMDKTPVKFHVPGAFYHQKVVLEPEPDYVPPKRPKPREVNPKFLSEYQKELAKRNAFEQDLYIIEQKKKAEQENKPKNNEVVYKLEKMRNIMSDEAYEQLNRHVNTNRARYKELNNTISQQNWAPMKKKRFDPERIWRNEEEGCVERGREALDRVNAVLYPPALESYLTEDFVPNRKTRATKLKEDYIRRELQKKEVEKRREKLNEELRKKSEAEVMKRMQKIPTKFNAKALEEKKMRDRRQKMREDEQIYMQSLRTNEESNALGPTFLERIEAELLQH